MVCERKPPALQEAAVVSGKPMDFLARPYQSIHTQSQANHC